MAELLAQHGGNVDGSRRRRRRAADDDDEQGASGAPPASGRRAGTDPQALIDRARTEAANSPSARREGGRRARPDQDTPPLPRRQPTDSGQHPQVSPAEPAAPPRPAPVEPFGRPPQDSGGFPRSNPAPNPLPPAGPRPPRATPGAPQDSGGWPQDSGGYPRPNLPGPQQDSGGFARPNAPGPQQDSGGFARPNAPGPQQDSGGFARPNAPGPQQDSGGFARPNAPGPQESGAFGRPPGAPPPDSGGFPRPGVARPPQESGAYPRPAPPQESGAFARPNNAPGQDSSAFHVPGGPLPSREPGMGRRIRPQEPPVRRGLQESAGLPLPEPPAPDELPRRGQDTHAQIPRHATPPPPQPGAAAPPSGLSARLDGLDAVGEAPPDGGGMASGTFPGPDRAPAGRAFPALPRRRRRAAPPPAAEPHTEQFQPVDTGESLFEPAPDAPPAGLSTWGRGRPNPISTEDTQVGVSPVVPAREPDPGDQLEATGYHDPFADDDEDEEYAEFGGLEEAGEDLEDYEYREEPARIEDERGRPEPAQSPARQWITMAIQLTLGVVSGAAVWLGFNWLWGQLPAAALGAAVVVIAALVWIVRKIRRAEDLQTTVLAVLVGLVVTVSPAALLLLSR
ncbi:hypothetical protein Atai01_03820 [Amycolatopsis taiwanensis]|uniref:Uncharacterized protein n=1 Tax=Amycolatopsis taiwanensis TaxID=342230 RepID=A0A9W6QWL4_9PSEU|nr:hypothetical protein Atai01_03820 [Amycolatopsis taiwanensis]